MVYRLPPLNALRAFEAAARHMSFQKAAGELHVTPAALPTRSANWRSIWDARCSSASTALLS